MRFQSKNGNVMEDVFAPIALPVGFPVAAVDRNIRGETPDIPPHIHDCLEIGYCHCGKGIFLVEDKILQFHAGDAVFINNREMHIMFSDPGGETDWSFLNLQPGPLLHGYVADSERWTDTTGFCGADFHNIFDPEKNPELTSVIREIVTCRVSTPPDFAAEIRALVWMLLIRMHRAFPALAACGTEAGKSTEMPRLLPALQHIAAHLNEPLSIPVLARLCCTSEANFRKLFHRATGSSPKKYLQTLRMKYAEVKLRHGDEPILAVALDCGFNSISNFNRQFAAVHGIAPRQYRAQWR